MEKTRLDFFLDYGICFWGDEGGYTTDELPFTPETRHEIDQFLREFDQHYSYGCPPNNGWALEECKRFNREMRRIFSLAEAELKNQFVICHRQSELMEDEETWAEYARRGEPFYRERQAYYDSFFEYEEN